jgi:hypothetical protein
LGAQIKRVSNETPLADVQSWQQKHLTRN